MPCLSVNFLISLHVYSKLRYDRWKKEVNCQYQMLSPGWCCPSQGALWREGQVSLLENRNQWQWRDGELLLPNDPNWAGLCSLSLFHCTNRTRLSKISQSQPDLQRLKHPNKEIEDFFNFHKTQKVNADNNIRLFFWVLLRLPYRLDYTWFSCCGCVCACVLFLSCKEGESFLRFPLLLEASYVQLACINLRHCNSSVWISNSRSQMR